MPSPTKQPVGGEKRPRTVRELQERFSEYSFASEAIPVASQAKTLLRLLDVYEQAGLLPDERPTSLCSICRNKTACWSTAKRNEWRQPRRSDAEDDENGCVPLPWVGPRYRRGGVVVLGINPNIHRRDYSDVLIEHSNTWCQYIANFRRGKRSVGGSRFGFAAMRSAAALLDALDGPRPRLREPEELVETMLRTARLQAIKCMPKRPSSKPYADMWRHCPQMLLMEELNVLKPGVVLALGRKPVDALEQLEGFDAPRSRASRSRIGTLRGRGFTADVYSLPHPRGGNTTAEESFIRSLR